jgi:hypothetical protein
MKTRLALWSTAIGIVMAGLVPAAAPGAPAPPAARAHAAAKCRGTKAAVGGNVKCLHIGDTCQKRHAREYLLADLVCTRTGRGGHRKLRLRHAGYAQARQGRVLELGRSGKPTFTQALWYFDQTIAHLPGVKVPRGAVGRDSSGTSALKSLYPFRDRLTKAQRKVLDAALQPVGAPLARFDPGATPARARAADVSGLTATLSEAVTRLRSHGVLFVHPIALYDLTGTVGKTELARTGARWLFKNKGNECAVMLAPKLLTQDIVGQRQTILHELMHCASGELVSSAAAWNAQPKFLDEGLPEWASYRVGLEWSGTVKSRGWWQAYLGDPSLSLFTRVYDAAGWWSLIEHEGADPFKLFPKLVAAGTSGNPLAVYAVARDAAGGDLVKSEWGPTLAQITAFGSRWDLKGPGETHRAEPDRGTVTNTSNPSVGAADEAGADQFKVDVQAEIVKVTGPKQGAGFFRDAGGTDWSLDSSTQKFCTEPNGCVCPDGTELPYPKINPGVAHVGFATEASVDTVTVDGQSIDSDPGCKGQLPGGITVYGQNDVVLARFRTGTCSAKAGFTAHATATGYTLDVTIKHFTGYKDVYTLDYGGTDPVFTVKGPGGPYSNTYHPPQYPPGGGAIAFNPKGSRMSLGFIEAFNPGGVDGVKLVGVMACRPPKSK